MRVVQYADDSKLSVVREETSQDGVIKEADVIELSAALLLYENGKGEMEFDGDRMEVTQWTLEEESFFMTMADGSSAGGTIRDGILLLDLYGT